MNKHRQLHTVISPIGVTQFTFTPQVGSEKILSNILSVDQYFAQEHMLRNGFIDTSPELAENPATQGHMFPLQEKQLPKRTDEELFSMNVSKHCQTLAEVSALAKSIRPDVDVNEPSVEDTSESTPQPSETE